MSRVQLRALTNEELLQHVYMLNYNVPAFVVQELYERFAKLMDLVKDDAE